MSGGDMSAGSGQGKRGASGPIVTTSDEEEQEADSPVSPIPPSLVDHDYENVSSPGNSSTASGPTYVRQPGFSFHAHEVTVSRPRVKKKKSALISVKEGIRRREPTPPKSKPKREPLPMRMRALPQSFWQQPNVPHDVSPANAYPILPPLINREGEAVSDERPVTPPQESEECEEETPSTARAVPVPPTTGQNSTSSSLHGGSHKTSSHPRVTEHKISIANTDLLFKLFEGVEKKAKPNSFPQLKRHRPRKFVPCSSKTFLNGEDPYLMECVTDKMFPHLTLEQSGAKALGGSGGPTSTLQLVTLREGDKSITLPSLSIEQNYPQMLSELVMNI